MLAISGVRGFGAITPTIDITVTEPVWGQYGNNPKVINLDQVVDEDDSSGALFVHDLDGDTLMDFVVTTAGVIGAYKHSGGLLWRKNDNILLSGSANSGQGYPGRHAPGAIAGDTDGDLRAEVAHLTTNGKLKVRNGLTGAVERTFDFPAFTRELEQFFLGEALSLTAIQHLFKLV